MARAEAVLGICNAGLFSLQQRLEAIVMGAAETMAVDETTFDIAYRLSQERSNVGHEKLKQQPAGPLLQPKQEPTKQ
ncbi:hypothetical protein XI07_13140 [Bradyrhizobium sp. CCBAU 11445]|uniref:hypothetical protein n=1 Tax=Bradyrhizobium sp. CCBAU 11445 TaxID=1630896 RepID=UPI002305060C|nr:hypothetical protein [Bradyrhizobium sp. CCBAU 11445]MDA9482957.1 hypothetical protein [Bradyrhizobium sp. CCBAU 11445]